MAMGQAKKGGNALSHQNTKLNAIRVQTSAIGQVIPIIIGAQRAAYKMIDYTDFTAHVVTSGGKKSGGGGKKGAGDSQQYTYSATPVAILCTGGSTGIQGLHSLWDTQGKLAILTGSQVGSVVAGGGTITATPPGSGVYLQDTGTSYAAAYSVPVNDYGSDGPTTLSGTQNIPLVYTASPTPGVGQYTVNPATGVYTFGATPTGGTITASINYTYTIPNAQGQGSATETLNLTLFTGTRTQAPWSFMVTNHPTHALNYRGVAYIGAPNEDLGASGALPNFTFEVYGLLPFGSGIKAADPSEIIKFILTDPYEGVSFDPTWVDALTNYRASCLSNGLFLSPIYDAQVEAGKAIDDICGMTNAAVVFTQGILKIRSYFDTSSVANGAVYSPETQPIFDLGLDDFISDGTNPPVEVTRSSVSNANNSVAIEFLNATKSYNPEIAEAKDQGHIETYGLRKSSTESCHAITDSTIAKKVVDFKVKREVYIRNEYKFKLGMQYVFLDPMDLVTLTEPELGLNQTPVRIKKITEDSRRVFNIEAEEFPWGTAQGTLYPHEASDPFSHNGLANPGDINPPIIFEANARLSFFGSYEIWMALSGASTDWGGCGVNVAWDPSGPYVRVGELRGASNMGVLSNQISAGADPDQYTIDIAANSGAVRTGGNTVTLKFTSNHNWTTGSKIAVAGITDAANFPAGTFPIASTPGANTVTYIQTGANVTSGNGSAKEVLSVNLAESFGTLSTATQADADNFRTLCFTDNELMSFQTATLTNTNAYDLSYLRRGIFGYPQTAHSAATDFARLDDQIYILPVDPTSVGKTLYLKFTSFNTSHQMEQDISNVAAHTIVIQGWGVNGQLIGNNATIDSVDAGGGTGANIRIYGAGGTPGVTTVTWTKSDGSLAFTSAAYSGFTLKSYNTAYWITYNPIRLVYSLYTTATAMILAVGNGDLFVGSVLTVAAGGGGGSTGGGGGSGGGGFGGCPALDMYVSEGVLVSDSTPGQLLDCLENDRQTVNKYPVQWTNDDEQPCVRLVTRNGAELTVSESTPIPTLLWEDGLLVGQLKVGNVVLTDVGEGPEWSDLVIVEPVGLKKVRRVFVGGRNFAAGKEYNKRIFSHNVIDNTK